MHQDVLVAQQTANIVSDVTADDSGKAEAANPALSEITGKFAHANFANACRQILDTLVPYGVLWASMIDAMQQKHARFSGGSRSEQAGVKTNRIARLPQDLDSTFKNELTIQLRRVVDLDVCAEIESIL